MHTIETPFGEPGFLVLSGSRLYGIEGPNSDYDYVGALIEPEIYRVGLKNYKVPGGVHHQHGFEQHVFKGDNYEGQVYSLWKLAFMLADGNPTMLCVMFADPITDRYGICTDEFRKMAVSRRSAHRFLKYMSAQRESMIKQRARADERKDLIARFGYDTKFAGHLVRLGYQGIEFLTTGRITLPMPDESLTAGSRLNVLDIRAGKWTMTQVLAEAEALERRMEAAYEASVLPETPDWDALNEWVVDKYQQAWFVQALNRKIDAGIEKRFGTRRPSEIA